MEEKYYEILRHYVNPNDCAIVVKQLLSLHNVSQQRELLEAYDKFAETEHGWFIGTEKETKDKFLAFNCG